MSLQVWAYVLAEDGKTYGVVISDFMGNGNQDLVINESYQLTSNAEIHPASCNTWLFPGGRDDTFQDPRKGKVLAI